MTSFHFVVSFRMPTNKTIKAILINPVLRSVSEVTIPTGGLDEVYRLTECSLVQAVEINDKGDSAYVDEESNDKDGYFTVPGFPYPLAGNAIVTNVDRHGNTIAPKTTAAEIAGSIRFYTKIEVVLGSRAGRWNF